MEKTNLGFNCRPIFPSEIHCTCKLYFGNLKCLLYRPFHNTLPRSSVFVNRISVRIYEMDCMRISLRTNSFLMLYYVYIQGVEFKSAHFHIFLRNCIKWDSIIIFNPNKKQNGGMEQISKFYLKFMTSASDLTLIQPHIWWRDLTKTSLSSMAM